MNKPLCFAVIFSMLAVACRKNDSNDTSLAGSWKVGSSSYTSIRTHGEAMGANTYTVEATSSLNFPFDGISFTFSGTSAPAAGLYRVVTGGIPSAGQVCFGTAEGVAATGPASNYMATGNDNVNATVTVIDGRISISMPDAWAKNAGTDSVKVSANITQTQ
jgi:hypothetical protein